jgi:hypothetical protein
MRPKRPAGATSQPPPVGTRPGTFLEEARDASLITQGAIVIAADEIDPVIARVVSLTPESQGTVVRLEILPGDPLECADALAGLACCQLESDGM